MVNIAQMKDGLKIVLPWAVTVVVVGRLFAYTAETARQAESNAEALRKLEKLAFQVSQDHDKIKDMEGHLRVHENRLNQHDHRLNQIESNLRRVADGRILELMTGEVAAEVRTDP